MKVGVGWVDLVAGAQSQALPSRTRSRHQMQGSLGRVLDVEAQISRDIVDNERRSCRSSKRE